MRQTAGFTLLEILIALTITALLMLAMFGLWESVVRTESLTGREQSRSLAAEVLLDRVERELVGAVMIVREEGTEPLTHPYLFVGDDRSLDGADTDTLRFISQTPIRPPGAEGPLGPQLVSYAVEQEEADVLHLVRTAEPLPDEMSKDIDILDAPRVAEDVVSFQLRYQGAEGTVDRWDSTSVENLDDLPLAVEVTVRLWKNDGDGEFVEGSPVSRRIELPVRPFALKASDPNSGAGDDGACVTAACVEAIAQEIESQDPTIAGNLRQAQIQSPNVCLDAENLPQIWTQVLPMLEGLGYDLEVDCP